MRTWYVIDRGNRYVTHRFLRDRMSRFPHETHPKRSMLACLERDMFILPGAALISRSAFDEVGGFDEHLIGYEDDDLFFRLFRAGYEGEFLDVPVTKWRIHASSSTYSAKMV